MVARGDLGVEISLERVPRIQKSIIRRARRKGRFVITATQMLESMIANPTPTRAEVSDVANAIYDGTDAVMLSAETSVGKYPVEAVRFMARIAAESEDSIRKKGYQDPPHQPEPQSAEILADAAHHAARESGAKAIVVFTSRGSSARLVSRYRPPVGVFAITPHDTTARQLSVSYGVTPLLAPDVSSTDEMLNQMDQRADRRRLAAKGRTGGVRGGPARGTAGHYQSHETASRRTRVSAYDHGGTHIFGAAGLPLPAACARSHRPAHACSWPRYTASAKMPRTCSGSPDTWWVRTTRSPPSRGRTASFWAREPTRWGTAGSPAAAPAESIRLHHEMVRHVLDEAGSELAIPAERRVLLGFSQPVSLNYRFAEAHPDAVRGLVGLCGGLPGDWDDERPGRIRPAVLHIARSEDEFYPPERTEQYARRLRLRCDDVEFHLLEGGHRFPSPCRPNLGELAESHNRAQP